MKKVWMLILCMFIVSCEKINLNDLGLAEDKVETPQTDLNGDLKYMVNGGLVGQGYNSSSVSRNFISCAPSVAFTNNAFSNILKSFKVAYGATASAYSCGACTGLRFSCTPGDVVTISGSYFFSYNTPAGTFSEPADYDNHISSPSVMPSSNITCPSEGHVEVISSGGTTSYVKVTATSIGNSDTEYLECQ